MYKSYHCELSQLPSLDEGLVIWRSFLIDLSLSLKLKYDPWAVTDIYDIPLVEGHFWFVKFSNFFMEHQHQHPPRVWVVLYMLLLLPSLDFPFFLMFTSTSTSVNQPLPLSCQDFRTLWAKLFPTRPLLSLPTQTVSWPSSMFKTSPT